MIKISYDKSSNKLFVSVDDDSVAEALKIRETMATEGWQILAQMWMVGRETLLDAMTSGVNNRATIDLSPIRIGILSGFNQAASIGKQAVTAAEALIKNEEDKKNDEDEE